MRVRDAWLSGALVSITLLAAMLVSAGPAGAGSHVEELGFHAAVTSVGERQKFEEYALLVVFRLPWRARLGKGWVAATRGLTSVGALRAVGKEGLIVSAGPGATLRRADGRFGLDAGFRVAYLSEDEFGDARFGGAIQFISHVGVQVGLGDSVDLGYRFQHMSNGNLYSSNAGLNLLTVFVGYHY